MKSFFQFLNESAAQQAARLGLKGDGHGGWYKGDEFVAKTEKGRLKFYNKRQQVGKGDPDQTELEKNITTTNEKIGELNKSNKTVLDTLSLAPNLRVDYGNGVCLIVGVYDLVDRGINEDKTRLGTPFLKGQPPFKVLILRSTYRLSSGDQPHVFL